MNKWIFSAAIFTILLNFATLLLPLFIPGINSVGTFGISTYQEGNSQTLEEFSTSVSNPETPMTDKGNLIYRVLDMINIGFISKFVITIKTYVFAFPDLIYSIVGPMMTVDQRLAVSTTLYAVFSIAWGLFIFGLWSGRDLRED